MAKTQGKKKILIIEDEGALLEVLTDKFTRDGFEVAQAQNGEEGLKAALKTKPDLILLDIIMPAMDGLTMLKKLRNDTEGQGIPVIIISNLSEVEKISEILGTKKGVLEHIVKSHWSMDELVKKVKQTLGLYNLLKQ